MPPPPRHLSLLPFTARLPDHPSCRYSVVSSFGRAARLSPSGRAACFLPSGRVASGSPLGRAFLVSHLGRASWVAHPGRWRCVSHLGCSSDVPPFGSERFVPDVGCSSCVSHYRREECSRVFNGTPPGRSTVSLKLMHVLSAVPTSGRSVRRLAAEGMRRRRRKLFLQLLAVAHVPIPERHANSRLGNRRQHIRGLVVFGDPAPAVPTRRSRPNTGTCRVTAAPIGERRSVFRQLPNPVDGRLFAFLRCACGVFAFLRRACRLFALPDRTCYVFEFLCRQRRVLTFLSLARGVFTFLRRVCRMIAFLSRERRVIALLGWERRRWRGWREGRSQGAGG